MYSERPTLLMWHFHGYGLSWATQVKLRHIANEGIVRFSDGRWALGLNLKTKVWWKAHGVRLLSILHYVTSQW